ncbi:hypothetical protein LSAT2_025984, partial [Lamellibrachia satsuma]
MKQDCKAGLKLSLSVDRQSLVVTDVNEQHNHIVSEQLQLRHKVVIAGGDAQVGWLVNSSEGQLTVSPSACMCKFRTTMN